MEATYFKRKRKDDSLWHSVGKVFRAKNLWCPCKLCKKYIGQVDFIWFTSPFGNMFEEKKFVYILYLLFIYLFLRFFIYIFHLGWVRVHRLCGYVVQIVQGSAETKHFLEISSLGNWVKFLYFMQWLSLSSVFVSMFGICLFIYLYAFIISRTSFRVNPHSTVCLNLKELLARSRRHIWSLSDSKSNAPCRQLFITQLNHLRPVWLNGWVFVYELSGCGFESRCVHYDRHIHFCWCELS